MQKNANFFWGGGTAPYPSGEGDNPSPRRTLLGALAGAFGAQQPLVQPRRLDLTPSILKNM